MKRPRQPPAKVIAFRTATRELEHKIRELAKDSGNILWGGHIRERMEERGFVSDDVLRVLRFGYARGEPERTEQGEWKIKMVHRIKGARDAGVVTIILHDDRLFLKTVEWEDQR